MPAIGTYVYQLQRVGEAYYLKAEYDLITSS